MAILLFSLRGVPEDEAYEVRELLTEHEINFYETSAGNWGVSMPALWLRETTDLEKARHLLADYQQQRQILQRQRYLVLKQAGQLPTFWDNLKQKPLLTVSYLVILTMVLMASIKFLLELGLAG